MQETIRWSEPMLLNDELAWQFLMLFLHFFLIRMQSICERLPDGCWNVHNFAPGFMKFVFANISASWSWYLQTSVHLGTQREHQVLNGSHILTRILLLFGAKFQYSRKRIQDEEGKQSDKACIRDLVLSICPTMRRVEQRKLKLLLPVYESHCENCGGGS